MQRKSNEMRGLRVRGIVTKLLVKEYHKAQPSPVCIITKISDQAVTSDENLIWLSPQWVFFLFRCRRRQRCHYFRHSSRCTLKVRPDELERQLCYREQPLSMIVKEIIHSPEREERRGGEETLKRKWIKGEEERGIKRSQIKTEEKGGRGSTSLSEESL